jgi:hypothetical protein
MQLKSFPFPLKEDPFLSLILHLNDLPVEHQRGLKRERGDCPIILMAMLQ